jgi:hypothetical protein
MSKSLALIVNEASKIESMLIESGGEITPEIEAFMAVNAADLSGKVDSYNMVMDRFETLEAFYKSKADEFSAYSKRCQNIRKTLEDNIKYAMQELKTDEVLGNEVRFKLVATKPRCVVLDESKLPAEYLRTKTITEVDKPRLSEDLKIGKVEGAELQGGFSLRAFATRPQIEGKKK